MDNNYIVIKCGGSVLSHLTDNFYQFVYNLWENNRNQIILVHGGGIAIKAQEKALGIESTFINGLRKTSLDTLRVIKQILNGELNTNLVLKLLSHQIDALGISGVDGALVTAQLKDYDTLGYVGSNLSVNRELLLELLGLNKLLVVSSLALNGANRQECLNINADMMSLALAESLQAKEVIFVSDVDGVLDKDKRLISQLSIAQTQNLISEQVITDGMVPKVESCMELIHKGIQKVTIINGQSDTFTRGTVFVK